MCSLLALKLMSELQTQQMTEPAEKTDDSGRADPMSLAHFFRG